MIRYKKNGAPTRLVRIPIGISENEIVLEIVSARVRKAAPRIIDAGLVFRVLHPMIILVMCGITRPIHPITPDIETADATIITDRIKTIDLRSFVFIPRDFASSSFKDNRLILQESKNSITMDTKIGGATLSASTAVHPEREPIKKYVMDGSVSFGSAINFAKLNKEEKIELIMMPPSTNPRIWLFGTLDAIM